MDLPAGLPARTWQYRPDCLCRSAAGAGDRHYLRPVRHRQQPDSQGGLESVCGTDPEYAAPPADVLFILFPRLCRNEPRHYPGRNYRSWHLPWCLCVRGNPRRDSGDTQGSVRGGRRPGLWLYPENVLYYPAPEHQDHFAAHGESGCQPDQEYILPLHYRRK